MFKKIYGIIINGETYPTVFESAVDAFDFYIYMAESAFGVFFSKEEKDLMWKMFQKINSDSIECEDGACIEIKSMRLWLAEEQ